MLYSPKGFQDIVSKAKMAPAQLQSPLNFAYGGLVYDGQSQINDMMASPSGFSGMSDQLNMAEGGMVDFEQYSEEPSQDTSEYYPVSGEATQQQSPFATGLMPQDTPPLTPPIAPPSTSTPYPARVMGSFSNSPGSNSIAPPLSSVDQTKTIADPAPVPAPTISPVAMAHGGAVGGRMASTMKAEFSKRGLDFDKYMAKRLAAKGHNGDTMLAHINPSEAQMLKQAGGSGRINPDTGLMSFEPGYGGLGAGATGNYGNSGGYQDQGRGSGVVDRYDSKGAGNTGGSGNSGGGDGGKAARDAADDARAKATQEAIDRDRQKTVAEVLKRVNDQTQTPLEKQIADDFNKIAKQTGYVDPAQKLAMEQQQQERQQELKLERDQEAQRVQQENLTRAYQQMGANRDQYPQGPLSTFGDGSDILKTGSFEKEKSFGENVYDAVKSGAGSVYDAVSDGMSALDNYLKYNPKDLTLASMAGSGYLRPSIKSQDQVLPDSAESAYIAKPPLQLTRGINASDVGPVLANAPLPPVRDDMSSKLANASLKNPDAPPAEAPAPAPAPPAAAPPKKEESLFGNIFNDIIEHPFRTGINAVTSLIPGGALLNLGSNLTGMYPSVGQMAENAVSGQNIFSNAPQGILTGLTGGANASSPNQNMLTYDPVASYQNGVQFIPETTMGYGPYGNLTREQYRDQYGGRDVPVIPNKPKVPTTPDTTTPDTTTPDTPTNGLGLATYDPRNYLGLPDDPLTYGFGGEQVYYKAMGGAVGPLSQKRK